MLPLDNAKLAKMVNSQETLSVDNKDSDVVTDKFQLLLAAMLEAYID
jgi:hypothetical protein